MRELDNVVRAATIRCSGKQILERDLPPSLSEARFDTSTFLTLEELTRRHVAEALKLAGGNKVRAAAMLGVHRNTLSVARLRGLRIEPDGHDLGGQA